MPHRCLALHASVCQQSSQERAGHVTYMHTMAHQACARSAFNCTACSAEVCGLGEYYVQIDPQSLNDSAISTRTATHQSAVRLTRIHAFTAARCCSWLINSGCAGPTADMHGQAFDDLQPPRIFREEDVVKCIPRAS